MARFVLALTLMMSAAALAQSNGTQRVDGDYSSNWDDVKLEQDGTRVFGTYVCCGGGTIKGRIDDDTIRYFWKSPAGGEGYGVWKINGNRLDGTWGSGQSDSDGGRWDLVLKSSIAN